MTEETLCQVTEILDNSLVAGNHDSLAIFGIAAQNELRDCTRSMMMIASSGAQVEVLVKEIVSEIEKTEALARTRENLLGLFAQKKAAKEYKNILYEVDEMTTALKLQKATLLRDEKFYARLRERLDKCESKIQNHLAYGNEFLATMPVLADEDKQLIEWKVRLSARLDSLATSCIILKQSIMQLDYLTENARILLDRITVALSEAIPVWHLQVSMALDLEKKKGMSDAHARLSQVASESIGRSGIGRTMGIDGIAMNDEKLLDALKGILLVCKEDEKIKQELINVISE